MAAIIREAHGRRQRNNDTHGQPGPVVGRPLGHATGTPSAVAYDGYSVDRRRGTTAILGWATDPAMGVLEGALMVMPDLTVVAKGGAASGECRYLKAGIRE
jgi:hypothetical protein